MFRIQDLGLRNKSKNRNRLEIVRDMLFVASEKTRKTRIMYQASLSYRQLEKYLSILLKSGLLMCNDDSFYLITRRGKEFLQMYAEYRGRCRRISEEINNARKNRLLLENTCFKDKRMEKEVLI